MADPLSLAASIAGLVSLADTAFRHVYKYARDVKGAKDEITRVAEDLHSLAGILQSTRVLAQSLEEEGDTYDPAIRVHHIYHCEQTLSKINEKMKRAAQKLERGKLKDIIAQHVKWPFSKSETQEILGELERHKTRMSLSIATDSMQKMQLLLSQQEKTDSVTKETRKVVRELHTEILVDAGKRQILEFFLDTKTINPQTSLDANIRLRHPLTGLWLTESHAFIQWLDIPGSKIWLSGIPGGGKTVLAGAAIQEALTRASSSPTIGAAFFFCDFKNEETLKQTNILGAIASQLGRQKNEAFHLLRNYYATLHPMNALPKKSDADDLRTLVGKMCELFKQVLIVVDGIDECGDGMNEIAEMISDLASDSETMSLAVFSRDEAGIRRQLDQEFKPISVAARSKDIELYVRSELESLMHRGRLRVTNPKLKDEIREALVDQAQGMFRWVACQLDHLCGYSNDFDRRKALGHLPPTLHETYLRLLQRLSKLPVQTQLKIQMCFQFIAFCPTRMSTVQLREAISTPEVVGSSLNDDNMVSEDEIASMCGSLLKRSSDGTCFEFAHFSVREFLEHRSLGKTPGLENYRICQSECYRLLACQSLRYLQLSNFVLDPLDLNSLREHSITISTQEDEKYSFHRLAAEYSLRMATHTDPHSIIHGLMNSLFDPSKTSCLALFAMSVFLNLYGHCHGHGLLSQDINIGAHEFATKLLSRDFLHIHFAAALSLPTVCDYLISTGSDPKIRSPLGTPLELAVGSFLLFINDSFNLESLRMRPVHLCTPVQTLLPTSLQRNLTIDILERSSQPRLDLNSSIRSKHSPLLLPACIIALVHNDFRVLQRLLSHGANLDNFTYTAVFRELTRGAPELFENDPAPLLGFLQHIGSLLHSESEWQFDLGRTIWNAAVEVGLPFTRDPLVPDSRITMSRDALVAKAFATIGADDLPGLQNCLDDGRLDLSERYRDPWRSSEADVRYLTLLHFAVLEGNLEATSHLAAAGCDPNIPSARPEFEWLPIHDCREINIFERLVAFGAQVTAREAHTGYNIWHRYAMVQGYATDLLDHVAKKYPLETAEALLTKSILGCTPLERALLAKPTRMPRQDRVERIMTIISLCSVLVGFWSIHEPLYGAAAEYGSEEILHRLIEVGARLDPVGPSQETPLHHVGVKASSAMVQCVKKLYPRALNIRFQDRYPLQLYLENCCHHNFSIEDSVARELMSAESLESIDGNGATLWEHYWGFNHIYHDSDVWRSKHAKHGCETICYWLLRNHSAILAYEASTGRSGVNMVFEFFVSMDWTEQLESHTCSSPVLAQLVDASNYWPAARGDPSVLRFLQFTIRYHLYGYTDMLLDRGVSVSELVDSYSSIQIACQPPLAISVCSSTEGKEIVCRLLDLAGTAHLNELAMDGLTILHRFATTEEAGSQLDWLIQHVLDKGVDINKKGKYGMTPLVHHVANGSLLCAEYLLQKGADPWIRDDLTSDAATEAASRGFPSFLDKLLEISKTKESSVNWGRKLHAMLFINDGRSPPIRYPNVLHLACWAGHIDCLEFYVNNNLINDLEAASTNGWTTMHTGAFKGHARILESLKSNGCLVMPRTVDGTTPLHLAVQQRRYDACKTLIRLGAQDVADFTGVTPTMCAKADDEVMIQLLSEMRSFEDSSPPHLGGFLNGIKSPKALINAMQNAIRYGDIGECKRLYGIGCPINVNMKFRSPLVIALLKEHLDIAEWLLDNGTTTTVGMCDDGAPCFRIIELYVGESKFNRLIPKLVDRCIADGSGWPLVGNAGFTRAIQKRNTEGLSTMLKCIQERAGDIRY